MKWLKLIGKVVLNVVLPWVMTQVERKKAEKLGKVLDVVTSGVEVYNEIRETRRDENLSPEKKTNLVKRVIADFADDIGVGDFLKSRVRKYQDRVKEKIKDKADGFIGRWMNR